MKIASVKYKILFFREQIKNQIILLSKGKGKFNKMLYLWGLTPALIVTFFFQHKINSIKNIPMAFIIYFLILFYFSWHIFVVRQTLKVQPEYRKVKIKDKELFKGKTKEEISFIKKERKKSKIKKMLLLEKWDSAPPYVIIICFDIYIILVQLQGIFNIF
ncbi:MAG TPA: hypothetical protein VLL98_03575 [Rickettsiales bacterium]|nr:hypothetical protein [Rickettsiales bacterium]